MISKLPNASVSIFAKMTQLAIENNAVNLAQGFPDFPCPPRLQELLSIASQRGFNQYSAMPGYLPLREWIAQHLESTYHVKIDPIHEITISAGATQGLFSIISAFVGTNDKVIVFEPAYDSYGPAIVLQGGIPIYIRMREPEFDIPWDELEIVLRTQKIKMIMVNNPHNPTGTIWTMQDFIRLSDLCRDQNIILLTDEVYDSMVYDHQYHISGLQLKNYFEHIISCFSFGKTLHNTGWKIGYNIASEALTKEIRKVHQFMIFSVHYPSQVAIAEFLQENPNFIQEIKNFYEQKRNDFYSIMNTSKFHFLPTKASYFSLAKVPDAKLNTMDYAVQLCKEKAVATIPLSAFYHDHYDPHLIRFCFAKKNETMISAAQNLIN